MTVAATLAIAAMAHSLLQRDSPRPYPRATPSSPSPQEKFAMSRNLFGDDFPPPAYQSSGKAASSLHDLFGGARTCVALMKALEPHNDLRLASLRRRV